MSVTIIGLGLKRGNLTVSAMDCLKKADSVVLRTGRCEAAGWLDDNGVKYETFDDMYTAYDDFSLMYDDMAKRLVEMSRENDVAYGVFDLRDESVERLSGIEGVKFVPGPGVDGELSGYFSGPVTSVAACDIESFNPKAKAGVAVREIDSRIAASEVKLRLMERFPFDSPVVIARSRGVTRTTLDELDRLDAYDHTVSMYIPGVTNARKLENFGTDELRELAGRCENAPVSLAGLAGALSRISGADADDDEDVISLLGEIMLESGLICENARRRGRFSMDDAVSFACKILLRRTDNARYGGKTDA